MSTAQFQGLPELLAANPSLRALIVVDTPLDSTMDEILDDLAAVLGPDPVFERWWARGHASKVQDPNMQLVRPGSAMIGSRFDVVYCSPAVRSANGAWWRSSVLTRLTVDGKVFDLA